MAPQIPVDTSPVDHRGTAAQSWFVCSGANSRFSMSSAAAAAFMSPLDRRSVRFPSRSPDSSRYMASSFRASFARPTMNAFSRHRESRRGAHRARTGCCSWLLRSTASFVPKTHSWIKLTVVGKAGVRWWCVPSGGKTTPKQLSGKMLLSQFLIHSNSYGKWQCNVFCIYWYN